MNCRHCGSAVAPPFSIWAAPPSNAYPDARAARAAETWYPLRLLSARNAGWCRPRTTPRRRTVHQRLRLLQLLSRRAGSHTPSGTSNRCPSASALGADHCVVEVAANDGYLLQFVKARGIPCLGIEPTASTAAAPRAPGIEIVERILRHARSARRLAAEGKAADLIGGEQRARPCARHQRLRRRLRAPAQAARRCDVRVSAPDAAGRGTTSSTRSTTSISPICR